MSQDFDKWKKIDKVSQVKSVQLGKTEAIFLVWIAMSNNPTSFMNYKAKQIEV